MKKEKTKDWRKRLKMKKNNNNNNIEGDNITTKNREHFQLNKNNFIETAYFFETKIYATKMNVFMVMSVYV